ncbi:MAG: PKD domain-containing protein [Bacteroidota bacterium]
MLRILLTFVCVFVAATAYTQCSIHATSPKVCLGATTTFSGIPLTAADSAWSWNFGDGGSSSQASPSYQYQSAGIYTVTLRKYFKGGVFCDAPSIKIRVVTRPVSGFTNNTPYKQCFTTNHFAFNDQSRPGLSGAPLMQRTMIYDDGAFVIQQAPFTDSLPHHYLHPAGGKYKIVLEVKDTNGCIAQHLDSVVVYPAMNKIGLTASLTNECYYTDVSFKHNGFYNQANTAKITWLTGDGDTLYAPPFNQLTHRYFTDSGVFRTAIIIMDTNGCVSRDSLRVFINRSVLDTALHINDPVQCILDNSFEFFNGSVNTTLLKWTLSNADMHKEMDDIAAFITEFKSCGTINVRLELENGQCRFVKDTQVFVIGHSVQAASSPRYQCVAADTVEFTGVYAACDTLNNDLHFLWGFGDDFAPPCTTNTKNGTNVGLNCNFSTDEGSTKHFYSRQSDRCYQPYLMVVDSVTKCVAVAPSNVTVSQVDVGWDSSLAVPRRGVYYNYDLGDSCSNWIQFNFDEIIPVCRPEKMYFLRDSLCIPHEWIDTKLDTSKGWVNYESRCAPGFMVTYGVVGVIGNGANACYDTAWYRLQLPNNKKVKLKHRTISNNTCKPFDVAFEITDSVNYGIEEITCSFGDNSADYTRQYTSPGDTILESFFHVYAKPGVYPYTVSYKFKTGCFAGFRDTVRVGKYMNLINLKPKVCFPDSVSFEAYPNYYAEYDGNFWGDSTRALAGKEALYWNFGDDTNWHRAGKQMKYVYQRAGTYQVSVIIKDSTLTGCYDTIVEPGMRVEASRLVTNVAMLNDTFFCAPTIINYIDSSYVLLNDSTRTDLSITERLWNFGPEKPESYLRNPGIYYGLNGTYRTRLKVSAQQGCVSDTVFNIVIIGPQPRFVIVGDTFGCSPFTVKLKNETGKQLAGWIWYFNEETSQILSTNRDSQVLFTYNVPGTYKIDLVGEDRIYNTTTGTYSNCSEKFPSLTNPSDFHPRQVTVLKTDTLSINSKDSICLGEELVLMAGGTNQVTHVKWGFDDGTAELEGLIAAGTAHSYVANRTYKIKVRPVITMRQQCVAGTGKNVHVQFPFADFDYDDSAYPAFAFMNRSVGAVRYLWDFGQPSSATNTSFETNPSHKYVNENRNVIVCLSAFDNIGCMDSVCKLILLRPSIDIPNVFTPGNYDQANDAFDIDIEGWEKYEMYIYNRWGTLVFEGKKDGLKNDGINWNGKNRNDGSECPDGVYYLVFKYKFLNEPHDKVYHGTITLIRNKD